MFEKNIGPFYEWLKSFWLKKKWFLVPIFLFILLLFFDNKCNIHFLTKPISKKDKIYGLGIKVDKSVFTLLIAIIGLVGYSIRQRQKLIAEQIAKSRIEWLAVTRKYVSKYMSQANECWFRINFGQEGSEQESLNDLLKKTENSYYKSIYSFNPKEEISIYLEKYFLITRTDYNIPLIYKKNLTSIVGRAVETYFKGEWDKAKNEIQDGIVVKTKSIDKYSSLSDTLKLIDKNSLNNVNDSITDYIKRGDSKEIQDFITCYRDIMRLQKQLVYK